MKLDTKIEEILRIKGFSEEDVSKLFIDNKLSKSSDLSNMNKIIDRIFLAIEKNEQIFICGDYDVDGIVSTAIMVRFFREINYPVKYYIPKRKEEGYGISSKVVEKLKDQGAQLLISVDNGIAAFDAAQKSLELNLDLIITDHHDFIDNKIPNCFAVLNPKIDNVKENKFLSGAGVAFYLINEINKKLNNKVNLKKYLVLTMVASIADVVPLLYDNREIVKYGLRFLEQNMVTGLKTLFESIGLNPKYVTAKDIGYRIGPLLNAAGRLGDADIALKLLIEDDTFKTETIVEKLKDINNKRKEISDKAINDYINIDYSKEDVIVIDGDIHQGIIGIVAAKIKEKFNKPTIVISFDSDQYDVGKASCRSINGFDIKKAIEAVKEYHLGGGGHYMAAGFSIRKDQLEDFKKNINIYAKNNFNKSLEVKDYDIEMTIDDVNKEFLEQLFLLEPFGAKNESPQIRYSGKVTDLKIIKKDHLLLTLDKKVKYFKFFAKLSEDLNKYRVGNEVSVIGEISSNKKELKIISTED